MYLSGVEKQSAVVKLLAIVTQLLMNDANKPVAGPIEDFLHELAPSLFNDLQAKVFVSAPAAVAEPVTAIAYPG